MPFKLQLTWILCCLISNNPVINSYLNKYTASWNIGLMIPSWFTHRIVYPDLPSIRIPLLLIFFKCLDKYNVWPKLFVHDFVFNLLKSTPPEDIITTNHVVNFINSKSITVGVPSGLLGFYLIHRKQQVRVKLRKIQSISLLLQELQNGPVLAELDSTFDLEFVTVTSTSFQTESTQHIRPRNQFVIISSFGKDEIGSYYFIVAAYDRDDNALVLNKLNYDSVENSFNVINDRSILYTVWSLEIGSI
eukprot:GAHX01002936.1.p1 GENE.GAHX01002936.1~~GAHX01002936.1.p1  ORF type:complete len:247 (+),score=19.58 GAHX01002936.1:189-929(+)